MKLSREDTEKVVTGLLKKNFLWFCICILVLCLLVGCNEKESDVTILRIANQEEYIDEGGWDEEEAIELENGTKVIGENSIIHDFEKWYEEEYGEKVKVEYSTYGTNEELYNQMTLGNEFDLVCPSEYMAMKLMKEGRLQSYSDDFFDTSYEKNYYINGVSPYILNRLQCLKIDGASVSKYDAGYMWGTLGIVYNPEELSEADVAHWDMLLNTEYAKRITMKDSIRDSYFVAMGIKNEEVLLSTDFLHASDYGEKLESLMNQTDQDTIDEVEEILSDMRKNSYSLEVDSGKADLVSGKVIANMQWSGDAVYSLDQAEEDGVKLAFSVPEECTNLWLDGWCMMKDGVGGDKKKQKAAEAFVNFISRPDNVIRNMYYIGYTSAIAGGKSNLIYQYVKYCYSAEKGEESIDYPLGYFFRGEDFFDDKNYIIRARENQGNRQLYAAYPTKDVLDRSAIMHTFDQETNERISQMWCNIRCFSLKDWF